MWSISYIEGNDIKLKGGFKSDKEVNDWINSKNEDNDFIPLKLLVWSELLQCCRIVEEYNKCQ